MRLTATRIVSLAFVCVFVIAVDSVPSDRGRKLLSRSSQRNTDTFLRSSRNNNNRRKLYNYSNSNSNSNNYNGNGNGNGGYGNVNYGDSYGNNYANYEANDYNNNQNYQNQNYENSNYIWQRDDDDNYKNDDTSYYNSNSQYSSSYYNGRGQTWGGQSVQAYADDEEPIIYEEGLDYENDEKWNIFGRITGLSAKETVAVSVLAVIVSVSLLFLMLLACGRNVIDFIGIYCCCGLFGHHTDQSSSSPTETIEDGFVKLGDDY